MTDEQYIDIAIEISKNAKYPYGAIVVKDGEIIGRSDDKTLMETSMYSHAELEAIESASKNKNLYGDLKGATMYVSCEPCMMCLAKKFPIQAKTDYKMDYSQYMLTTEIRNKTVGIIGLGTIGSKIADMCQALGMNVIYWNRSERQNSYKKVDLETIFKEADFIFPAFATNDETSKLITDDLINAMNGNAFINVVNNPRELYNHDLLLNRAENEEISYAFELYGNEKKMYDYKGNVMATAPYAFYTREAIDRLVAIWCDNVINLVNDKPQNVVSV